MEERGRHERKERKWRKGEREVHDQALKQAKRKDGIKHGVSAQTKGQPLENPGRLSCSPSLPRKTTQRVTHVSKESRLPPENTGHLLSLADSRGPGIILAKISL